MGIETEYGITTNPRKLGPDETARVLFRPVVDQWASSNIFTHNASRLYLDVGSHPEVATAECDSIYQLLAYDRAGDRIVDDLGVQAEQALKREGADTQIYLFKNNLDSVGNSYGCHENYLVSRTIVLKTLGLTLLPFLITRQLICGAGKITEDSYQLSQRADHVWEGVSSATTRSRPIINTRDEAHADTHLYRRLHIIVGDSNLAQPSFALKVGSALLMLEMIEAEFPDMPRFEFANDMAAIRDISRDITGRARIELKTGGTITALEVQQEYCQAAQKWLGERPANDELRQVVDLWAKALEAIEAHNLAAIERDIDWAIKLSLLQKFQKKLGVADFQHPKLQQIDLAYHDIRPGRGLFQVLEAKGLVNTLISPADVAHAVAHPPATTRAALRGKFLAAAVAAKAPFSVDWLRLKVNHPEPQIIELGDPFAPEDARVDDLITYMETNQQYYQEL